MSVVFNSSDPAGQALQAEIAELAASIAALDLAVPGAAKAGEVAEARKAALELEAVQHALASGRLSAASIIENCSLA